MSGRASDMSGTPPSAGALAVLSTLARHRQLLWKYPLVITGLVTALAFLFPKVYRSQVTVLPPERDFQSVGEPVGGELRNLFGGGMALPVMATPSDILAAVLDSRTARDSVIAQLQLAERWRLPRDKANRRLAETSDVKVEPSGILRVWVEATDRWFGDTLVNALVSAADRLNQSIVNTKAARTRRFVEQRLAETKIALGSATTELERFQNEHRTVALDAEIATIVESAAQVRAQKTADEIELSILEGSLSAEHPRLRALQTRIRETTQKLAQWESRADDTTRSFLGMGMVELPRLMQELAARLRDVKVAETLYELLTQQYEHARIQERRDTPTFSVLDWAADGGRKVRPRLLLIALGTLLSAVGLMAAFIIVRTYVEQLAHVDPGRHDAIVGLWQTVRPRRRPREMTP